MFTGIVTAIGTVRSVEPRGDMRLVVACDYDMAGVDLGASIACSGTCLTVVDKGPDWFAVDVSAETVSRTAHGLWQQGARLNLERALRLGDELGGHLVTGHVDGIATVTDVAPDGASLRIALDAPLELGPMIAAKGSITLDGVSLTVNQVEDRAAATRLWVNVIPHTGQQTTLGDCKPGREINLEIDVLARYLQRMANRV